MNDDNRIHECPKCNYLVIESEMVECIDAKTNTLLAYLCGDCIKDWLDYEKTISSI